MNFEAVNSFSSRKDWGSFSLEEAWVRYSCHNQHSVKLGQFIPVYNSFNVIKNRMPVFPYIIRPLVYEASFDEFLALEEYWPGRAFLQASGWFGRDVGKLEYALYVGNSPNINSDPDEGRTGADTTDAMLIGGRLGMRHGPLGYGLSYTRASIDIESIDNTFVQINRQTTQGLGWRHDSRLVRQRFGWDVSWRGSRFFLEAESTDVDYSGHDPAPEDWDPESRPPVDREHEIDPGAWSPELREALQPSLDKLFHYATVGCRPRDQYVLYGSFSRTEEDLLINGMKMVMRVLTFGGAYDVNDRIVLKMQVALDEIDVKVDEALRPVSEVKADRDEGHLGSAAVTVFF